MWMGDLMVFLNKIMKIVEQQRPKPPFWAKKYPKIAIYLKKSTINAINIHQLRIKWLLFVAGCSDGISKENYENHGTIEV